MGKFDRCVVVYLTTLAIDLVAIVAIVVLEKYIIYIIYIYTYALYIFFFWQNNFDFDQSTRQSLFNAFTLLVSFTITYPLYYLYIFTRTHMHLYIYIYIYV